MECHVIHNFFVLNYLKTVDNFLVDTVILDLLGMKQNIFILQKFLVSLNVLQLNFSNTISKIIDIEVKGDVSHITLYFDLFFMLTSLYVVNFKGKLKSK